MGRDGKRQAGAVGFFAPGPSVSASESSRCMPVAIALDSIFDRRKTRSFELVHRYTVCYSAKCDDGEGHERAGKAAAIPGGTHRKQCSASCFRYAWPSDERVL